MWRYWFLHCNFLVSELLCQKEVTHVYSQEARHQSNTQPHGRQGNNVPFLFDKKLTSNIFLEKYRGWIDKSV